MTLRELLASRNQTPGDLAAALGVLQANVSRWCSGKRVPRLSTALRIGAALNAVPIPGKNGWEFLPDEEADADRENG